MRHCTPGHHAEGCDCSLHTAEEVERFRLALSAFAADLGAAAALAGIRADEYPLKAVQRLRAQRDQLLEALEHEHKACTFEPCEGCALIRRIREGT
jgi:hypothetical protein